MCDGVMINGGCVREGEGKEQSKRGGCFVPKKGRRQWRKGRCGFWWQWAAWGEKDEDNKGYGGKIQNV